MFCLVIGIFPPKPSLWKFAKTKVLSVNGIVLKWTNSYRPAPYPPAPEPVPAPEPEEPVTYPPESDTEYDEEENYNFDLRQGVVPDFLPSEGKE